jgi:hypothetical protein
MGKNRGSIQDSGQGQAQGLPLRDMIGVAGRCKACTLYIDANAIGKS